jgi:nitrogen-specific signal transduction histidine kinase/CheY-like chemotaxis protein
MVVASARDVSERIRLEQQLRMSQKMEAVGLLAGGVAHDFNNLLTAIKGHIEMLLLETEPGHVVRADLEEIAKAADRAAELTRQLLAFSRRQIFTPAPLDLGLLVRELRPVLERMAGDGVRLTTSADSTLPVHADRGQIEQVLLDLVSNALEAMPRGGELHVATQDERVDPGAPLLRRHPYVLPREYVVLSVSDAGHGMDAATLARVFEPFFTTRNKDRAAGLGLSTAYGIVKQSDGYIIADSAPGSGSTLRVYLPRAGSTLPDDHASDATAERHVDPDRLVLVVEDEPAVRSLIGRVLTKRGYAVIEAANGREALQLAADSSRPVDLLISDIVMPGMDGPELARRLATLRPGLPVLLISGYSHDAIVREGGFPPGTAFLGKPFTPSELAARVEEILDR